MNISKSIGIHDKSRQFIPGGVNSPVRAFRSVGGSPIYIKSGKGSHITDVDGNEYIDFVGSWGPHLFGHNPDFISDAIRSALEHGTSFGAPTESELIMAELICSLVPSIEMVRMVNSGTEATMSAIRLARGCTGKDKIIKFEGCYHGHADSFLIKAGSGALTFGSPTSPGVPLSVANDTLVADFNNINTVKNIIDVNRGQIAALIIEPVPGNMGVILPAEGFLREIRDICSAESIILIFDEVMTGFRLAAGGAQELYGVRPDLTTLGKVIGGGLPVGAFGGRRDIMEHISPSGKIYQAGTLSGNPLAMAAGIASLQQIKANPGIYSELEYKAAYIEREMKGHLERKGLGYQINRVGSMMTLFFTNKAVTDYNSAVSSDAALFASYFHKMLEQGIYLAPSQYEAFFVSVAHSEEDIEKAIKAFKNSIE
jgi:glutamate-1-semialdehyde 2,1-aminomutase